MNEKVEKPTASYYYAGLWDVVLPELTLGKSHADYKAQLEAKRNRKGAPPPAGMRRVRKSKGRL